MAEQDTALAEELRLAVGLFVRTVRGGAGTPRTAQADALGLLDREGAMNVAAMAQHRGVTHQTMRLVVAELDKAGLVRRQPDPADRRSQLWSLTEAGTAELARQRAARAARIGSLIRATLSAEERVLLRQAAALLRRMGSVSPP